MSIRGKIDDVWRAYKLFRVLGSMGIGLGALGLGGLGTWGASVWRGHVVRAADSPEYMTNQTTAPDATIAPAPKQPFSWGAFLSSNGMKAVIALLVLAIIIWAVAHWPMKRPNNPFERDERREFSKADRAWIGECADHRCEHRYCFGLLRCGWREGDDGKAAQLDHWYPHSKGGATDRHNLVYLCPKHNNRKSAHVPTVWATRALERARLKYFPARWRAYARPDGIDHRMDEPDIPKDEPKAPIEDMDAERAPWEDDYRDAFRGYDDEEN